MTPPVSKEQLPNLADVGRRLALTFGILILVLMLIVLLAGGLYLRTSMEREQDRLSAVATQVLANAVSRISFSGKYHARLMLEEIKAGQPSIVYLRLVDDQGRILAHSDPAQDDQQIDSSLLAKVRGVLEGKISQQMRQFELDGVPVREISIAYRGGYDNAVISVLQVGFSELEQKRDLAKGVYFVSALVFGLLLLGIYVTWRISAHFGKPVRQLLEALERERTHLRTLVSVMPDLVWLKNADGVYLACNRRFEQFFGASEQDIVGKTDYDFVGKDLADSFRRHDFSAMESKEPCMNEEEIVFASDGHREILETTKTAMRDENGYLIGILGIGHDISERKRAEDVLQRSQSVLLALQQQSPLPMSYSPVSDDGQVRESFWNRAWYSTFGYVQDSKEGVAGSAFGLWAQPERRQRFEQSVFGEVRVECFDATLIDASGH